MKKIIFLGLLIVLLPVIGIAQEIIEAPVWNVGDKWVFDREGPMEVLGCDAKCYSVKVSGGILPKDAIGIAIFERSTLNIQNMLEKDRPKEYRSLRKKILNFPLTLGKQWQDLLQRDEEGRSAMAGKIAVEYRETFRVLGWEEVEVPAGKFKAIKLEYKLEPSVRALVGWMPRGESKAWYWYSPGVKNFVKCKHAGGYIEGIDEKGASQDWQLISYELKK